MSQGIYTPCLHGFEPKVCPTCQEPILRYQSVADARRLAKALEVVEAARHSHPLPFLIFGQQEVECRLCAALAAFDEVTK
jgi:hypothetical protein